MRIDAFILPAFRMKLPFIYQISNFHCSIVELFLIFSLYGLSCKCLRLWVKLFLYMIYISRKFMITSRVFVLICMLLEVNMMKIPVIQRAKHWQLVSSSLGYAMVTRFYLHPLSVLWYFVCSNPTFDVKSIWHPDLFFGLAIL